MEAVEKFGLLKDEVEGLLAERDEATWSCWQCLTLLVGSPSQELRIAAHMHAVSLATGTSLVLFADVPASMLLPGTAVAVAGRDGGHISADGAAGSKPPGRGLFQGFFGRPG